MEQIFDWPNIFATFGAAIIGAGVGAWAIMRQTKTTIDLEYKKWEKEKAYELIWMGIEYVNISFRPDETSLTHIDELAGKLAALFHILLKEEVSKFNEISVEVRKKHFNKVSNNHSLPLCRYKFPEVRDFFNNIQKTITERYLKGDKP